MKWSQSNIIDFLSLYEKYPVLWNIKDINYCNVKLKEGYFQQLLAEMEDKQLIGSMDLKQVKARIKSIKDAFRQELSKIEKSRKSGCGAEDVYKPKLSWFSQGSFLAEVIATRSSQSNLDLPNASEETRPVNTLTSESNEGHAEVIENTLSPLKMRPPSVQRKRAKKHPSETDSAELSVAIGQLDKIAQTIKEQPYEQFGKYVASELRQLPTKHAIFLQQEIQSSITRAKLSSVAELESHLVLQSSSSSNTNHDSESVIFEWTGSSNDS